MAQRTLTLPLHSPVHRRGSHLGDIGAGEWRACWNQHGTKDPLPLGESGMGDAAQRKEYSVSVSSNLIRIYFAGIRPVECNTPKSH